MEAFVPPGRSALSIDGIRGSSDRSVLVLTSLASGPKHGYALIKDIDDFAGVRMGPGTLYGCLSKLEEAGLIEALPTQDRRHPYRITAEGSADTERTTGRVGTNRQVGTQTPCERKVSRRTLVDWILHLYPRAWRDRYGEEVRDLMKEVTENGDLSSSRAVFGLFSSGLALRMRSSWRTLLFTGAILALAGGAVLFVNSVEYVQPSETTAATHTAQQRVRPQRTDSPQVRIRKRRQTPATQTPTAGPIPESAVNPAFPTRNRPFKVPDFIPTMSNGKVVGLRFKISAFPDFFCPSRAAIRRFANCGRLAAVDASSILTVYGPDLTTIIGHMYPGQIFVQTGQTPPPFTARRVRQLRHLLRRHPVLDRASTWMKLARYRR